MSIPPATTQASWRSATRKAALCQRVASPKASDGRIKQFLPLAFLVTFFFLFIPNPVFAESSKVVGNYTLHYIAVNSTFIDAKIAQQYKIKRGKRSAFINIAVLRNDKSTGTPVEARLDGSVRNLMQQSNKLAFQQVREGDAIYYLGQFEFSNGEKLHLKVDVQPEGKGDTYTLEWDTQLYSD